MLNQIIKFVEKNVDGCGTDAEVTVLIQTDGLLTNGHKMRLEKAIEDIRIEWEGDDWNTDSVVEEAIVRVFGADAEVKTVIPDLLIEL